MGGTSTQGMSGSSNRRLWYALAVVIIVIIIIGSVYFYEITLTPPAGAATPLTLYVGEISATEYGFGNAANSLSSNPGHS